MGWANRWVSVDAFVTHIGRHRGGIFGELSSTFGDIRWTRCRLLESSRSDGYVRIATGDPDKSLAWGQLMAVGSIYRYTGIRNPVIIPKTPAESAFVLLPLDTGVYRTQYIATAGVGRGPLRLSAAERVYIGARQTLSIPSVRASFGTRRTDHLGARRGTEHRFGRPFGRDGAAHAFHVSELHRRSWPGDRYSRSGQHVRLQDELRPG